MTKLCEWTREVCVVDVVMTIETSSSKFERTDFPYITILFLVVFFSRREIRVCVRSLGFIRSDVSQKSAVGPSSWPCISSSSATMPNLKRGGAASGAKAQAAKKPKIDKTQLNEHLKNVKVAETDLKKLLKKREKFAAKEYDKIISDEDNGALDRDFKAFVEVGTRDHGWEGMNMGRFCFGVNI